MSKKIIIIGSGPGGYHAAIRAASIFPENEVTIIEKQNIGGTCLNVGCIPTKALLDHLSLYEHFTETTNKRKIFSTTNTQIEIEGLRKHQTSIINQLQQGLEKLFKKKKIKLVVGEAKLNSVGKISVKTKENQIEFEADEIIIATGSKPKTIPGFSFDGKIIVSSDDIWNIPKIPKKLLIIGSGPIGIEFSRVFNQLGSKVTIAEIQEKICPLLDNELSENLVRSLKKRNIILKPNTASKLVEKKNDSATVEFISTVESKKEQEEFDQILIATGRKPNTESLGLKDCGIELEPQGHIKVNNCLQTNNPNIWAVGDVTNFPQLAHTASFQGRVVAENIAGNKKEFSGKFIPSCIFGYPEVAFVGFTEEEIKEKKINYKVGKSLFLASGKSKASGLTEGVVKILIDNTSKMILGAHIIGPEASILIHELVVAMQNKISAEQLTETIHAHPTYSEVILESLEDCLGKAIHA